MLHSLRFKVRKNLKNNFFLTSNQTRPDQPLPEDNSAVPPNFIATLDTIKFAWLGHSTILLSMQGKTILIDPVFQSSAAPVDWMIKRFQPPVLNINALPKIDYVLISHDHYDHLKTWKSSDNIIFDNVQQQLKDKKQLNDKQPTIWELSCILFTELLSHSNFIKWP